MECGHSSLRSPNAQGPCRFPEDVMCLLVWPLDFSSSSDCRASCERGGLDVCGGKWDNGQKLDLPAPPNAQHLSSLYVDTW